MGSTSFRISPTRATRVNTGVQQHDLNQTSQILDSQKRSDSQKRNFWRSVHEDNQRRLIYLISRFDQKNETGNDQAAEHSKTGIRSGNNWSRASGVLWVQGKNYEFNSKHLDQTALLQLDGFNPSRDRR